MRIGMFPGQAEAFRAIVADERRRERRRGFVIAGVAALVSGSIGLFAGRRSTTPAEPPSTPDPMHKVALGPITDLRTQAMHLAAALEARPKDHVLWLGFHRLVALSATRPEDDLLRRRLNSLAAIPDAPDHAVEAVRILRVERGK